MSMNEDTMFTANVKTLVKIEHGSLVPAKMGRVWFMDETHIHILENTPSLADGFIVHRMYSREEYTLDRVIECALKEHNDEATE